MGNAEIMLLKSLRDDILGRGEFEFVSNTAAHTGDFIGLQTIEPTVFSAILPAPTGNTFTGETIPANTMIMGKFTSVTLTSGALIAYKGVA